MKGKASRASLRVQVSLWGLSAKGRWEPVDNFLESYSDSGLPVSSVHGILQARILEWVAMPSSRELSRPRDQTQTQGFPQTS